MPLYPQLRASVASYLAILRLPYARRTFLAALAGRLSYGVVFLSLVLTVTRETGSYAVAGTVLALFGITSSVLAPYRARMIDRYGPRRVLPPMAAVYAVLLAAVAVTAWQHDTPRPVLWVLGAACGGCTPPLGPVMRTLWSILVPPEEGLLRQAYSLDTVVEELLYVVGPLLAGLFAASVGPAWGVATSAVLVLTGTLALASSPVVADPDVFRRGGAGADAASHTGSGAGAADERGDGAAVVEGAVPVDGAGRARRGAGARLLRTLGGGSGLLDPVLVTGGLGTCLGAFNLLAVAFAARHGGTALVAWVSATMSVSSAVGGLIYGSLSWRASNRLRLSVLPAGLGACVVLAGLAGTMPVMVALAGAAGIFVSPVLATAYLAAHEATTSGSRTESGTWVNTAFNVGNSAGAAGVGLFLSILPVAVCFALAAAMLFLPAAVVGGRLAWRQVSPEKQYAEAAVNATINDT